MYKFKMQRRGRSTNTLDLDAMSVGQTRVQGGPREPYPTIPKIKNKKKVFRKLGHNINTIFVVKKSYFH